jgi:hypothetical protein
VHRLLVTANVVPSSPIVVTLMMESLSSSETSVLTYLLVQVSTLSVSSPSPAELETTFFCLM